MRCFSRRELGGSGCVCGSIEDDSFYVMTKVERLHPAVITCEDPTNSLPLPPSSPGGPGPPGDEG